MEQVRIKVIAVGINLFELEILETIFESSNRYEAVGVSEIWQADIVMVNIDDHNAISIWKKHLDRPGCQTILIAENPPEYGQAVCLERRLLEGPRHAKRVFDILDRVAPEIPRHVEQERLKRDDARIAGRVKAAKSKMVAKMSSWLGELHEDETTDNPYYCR